MKLEHKLEHAIGSYSGRAIRLSTLRPGDWLIAANWLDTGAQWIYVVQNSAILKRMEIRWEGQGSESVTYSMLTDVHYAGRGRRRQWWAWLPKVAQARINEYSKP